MSTASLRPVALRPLVVGTVVWLSSEILFFGTLFGAWFTLRSSAEGPWPPEGVEHELLLPLVGTALLVTSSATVQLAVRRIGDGDGPASRRWLLVTLGLGAVFLVLQRFEWAAAGFGIDDHAYGTAFYALTGFHGLHVFGGLVALAVIARRVAVLGSEAHDAVEVVSLYWHFVDVVWLAVLASVHLAG